MTSINVLTKSNVEFVSVQSWDTASDRYREKLLELIGKIGKDDRQGKTASKVSPPVVDCESVSKC